MNTTHTPYPSEFSSRADSNKEPDTPGTERASTPPSNESCQTPKRTVVDSLGKTGLKESVAPPHEPTDESSTKNKLPSPETITPLLPQLGSIVRFEAFAERTISSIGEEAEATPETERTLKQKQLLKDIETIKMFSRSGVVGLEYTPEELHDLAADLNLIREMIIERKPPDRKGIQEKLRLPDVAHSLRKYRDSDTFGGVDLANLLKRSESPTRGMQWRTLISSAEETIDLIGSNLQEKSPKLWYFVPTVTDPDKKEGRDCSSLYQCAAYLRAFSVIGKRKISVSQANRKVFKDNCEIINAWHESVKEELAKIPHNFSVSNKRGVGLIIRRHIEEINDRLSGEFKYGIRKDYRLDPAGAVSHQLRIGHFVDDVRDALGAQDTESQPSR